MTLHIPEIPEDADNLEAALLYTDAGWYVVPVLKGTKNPGSVVGKNWQAQSSRDPQQIAAWFAAADHDIALHVGRSGAVVFDVDYPAKVPAALADHLRDGPFQSTRLDSRGRGHYLFRQPSGRKIGNGVGKLGSGWGDVRGLNGVIVAAPSGGGRYRWQRIGAVPELPGELADMLGDGKPGVDAATDAEVLAFVQAHTAASRPNILAGRVNGLAAKLEAGEGRHTTLIPFLAGAMEEAAAGFYSAQDAIDAIAPLFVNAVQLGDNKRTPAQAEAEFGGLLAWAVGQANAADLEAVRARVDAAMPDHDAFITNSAQPAPGATREKGPRVWRSDELTRSAPLDWLGVKHIPEAAVTLLTGDEGIGKSLVWVRIAAAVTTGAALPEFGIPARDPRHILVIVTEDDWSSTVRPRLELAGADMDLVNVVCSEPDGSGSPYFPRDINVVADAQPVPYLIVLDAWADTVEGHLSVRDPQQARQALHPWKEVATRLRAAVLLLTHTNRATGGTIRERYAMTSELRKKARMTLFAQQDDDGNLVVGPDKSNLVGKVAASVFGIEAVQVFDATDSSDGTVPRLVFLKGADFTAAELLTTLSAPPPSEGAQGFAQTTLAAILHGGEPHDRAEVIAQMAKVGIAESTAKRAAESMGVIKKRTGFGGGSTWQLPFSPPFSPSVSDDLNGLNGLNGAKSGLNGDLNGGDGTPSASIQSTATSIQSTFSPFSSPQTDGPNGDLNDAVEFTHCSVCGNELLAPESRQRGHCEACHLVTAARCDCGNRLLTPETVTSGRCKPCQERGDTTAEVAAHD